LKKQGLRQFDIYQVFSQDDNPELCELCLRSKRTILYNNEEQDLRIKISKNFLKVVLSNFGETFILEVIGGNLHEEGHEKYH
jgi:hypothetical protein